MARRSTSSRKYIGGGLCLSLSLVTTHNTRRTLDTFVFVVCLRYTILIAIEGTEMTNSAPKNEAFCLIIVLANLIVYVELICYTNTCCEMPWTLDTPNGQTCLHRPIYVSPNTDTDRTSWTNGDNDERYPMSSEKIEAHFIFVRFVEKSKRACT